MVRLQTNDNHMNTLCSSLTDWLDYGKVDHSKYPLAHQAALFSQARIGWDQFFKGHITQQWEILQGYKTMKNGTSMPQYMWSADIITLVLKHTIILWEQRNQDVHGHNESEQQFD